MTLADPTGVRALLKEQAIMAAGECESETPTTTCGRQRASTPISSPTSISSMCSTVRTRGTATAIMCRTCLRARCGATCST
ncbi:unnamed protein product, partial [Ectocarpus fasciculatus]